MDEYKEVCFHEWCKKCKHWPKNEAEDPCNDCLNEVCNRYSHKPIYFEPEETYANHSK